MSSLKTRMMWIVVLSLSVAGAGALVAQESPNDEPGTNATLFDRTDSGNVQQAAVMAFGAGERELKRARKLGEKLDSLDAKKRESSEKKLVKAYQNAVGSFQEAIRNNPKMVQAYIGLGQALRESGKMVESLQVSAKGLQVAPEDDDLFTGWAESIMELNMLGDAVQAYGTLKENNPARAGLLMGVMKGWVEKRRVDPGALSAEDVEKLAGWIAQQEAAG